MQYAMATWLVHGASPAEKIAGLHALGFDGVSLISAAKRFPSEGAIKEVIAALEQAGMSLTIHSAFGEAAKPGAWRQDIEAASRFQRQWDRKLVITFDPAYAADGDGEVSFDFQTTVAGLRHAVETLGPLGVKVGIENWLIASRPEVFGAYREEIPHQALGMLLDVGHLKIALAQDLIRAGTATEFLEAMPLPVWEVHVHDNDGVLDLHQPLLDPGPLLREVADALRRRGEDATLTLESKPEDGAWSLNDPGHARMLQESLACARSAPGKPDGLDARPHHRV